MRILHVVYECEPGRHHGGVQKVVYELASAQVELGHTVGVATIEPQSAAAVRSDGGLDIRRHSRTPGLSNRYSFALARQLRRSGERFDVVHAHNTFSPLNLTARRLARLWDAGLFIHSHGALDPMLLHGRSVTAVKKRVYIAVVERPTLNAAAAVFALSDAEASWIRDLGVTSDVVTVNNGIRPIDVPPMSEIEIFQRRFDLGDGPVVLYIGRFVPKKNLAMILRTVAELRADHPGLTLVLCGDRERDVAYVEQLDDLVEALGLRDAVRWTGFLDEREKALAYGCATLFVHSSLTEGMPMAVLEAMAAGVTCVVTPGTMMGEAARAGAVVEADGLEAFVSATRELLADPASRAAVAQRASGLVSERYSWPAIARRICDEYRVR